MTNTGWVKNSYVNLENTWSRDGSLSRACWTPYTLKGKEIVEEYTVKNSYVNLENTWSRDGSLSHSCWTPYNLKGKEITEGYCRSCRVNNNSKWSTSDVINQMSKRYC